MGYSKATEIEVLRSRIARLQATRAAERQPAASSGFGLPAIDHYLPSRGLEAALHEVAGAGPETEHAAAALFVAGLLARRAGPVLWIQERPDLYAPALAAAGLTPERVIYLDAGRDVLAAMEDGLRARSLAGVVGETSRRVTLTASRRLQLAAEASGTPAFLLRRSRRFDDPRLLEPNAATTRWRVAPLPSPPPIPDAPTVPGLARAVWRLDLIRCRGGEAASWIVEATDAQGHLRLVSDLSDRSAAADRGDSGEQRPLRHLRA